MEYSWAVVFCIRSYRDSNWLPFSGIFSRENSHGVHEVGSPFAESSMSCETSRWSYFCSVVSSFGTNFADTLRKAKSSLKMECTETMLIPTSSAISRTVARRSCMTKVHTWSMTSSFWLVEGLPKCELISTNVRPSLNWLYHSLICVMPMASPPKAC